MTRRPLTEPTEPALTDGSGSLSLRGEVEGILRTYRRFWRIVTDRKSSIWDGDQYDFASADALAKVLFPESASAAGAFFQQMAAAGLYKKSGSGGSFEYRVVQPSTFVRALQRSPWNEGDVTFAIRGDIRREARCRLTPALVQAFHTLSGYLDRCDPQGHTTPLHATAIENQVAGMAGKDGLAGLVTPLIPVFLEVCRELNVLAPLRERGHLMVTPQQVDAEYVISALFGIPTGIFGLDQLFGGFGPIWAEIEVGRGPSARAGEGSPGRVLAIKGRFGTGKSLLGAHLAASVARKGGIANVNALEQRVDDYLYAMATMGLLPTAGEFRIGRDIQSGDRLLKRPSADGAGAIVFFREPKDSLGLFFDQLRLRADAMGEYPLKLIVVDSINSIGITTAQSAGETRSLIHDSLGYISSLGIHVVAIVEEHESAGSTLGIEEHLADAVIRLSVRSDHGYLRRFVEVLKARYQREQRGEHPLAFRSGRGIEVYPAPTAVRARISARRVPTTNSDMPFGIDSLDVILQHSLHQGEIVLLEGPRGSFKSEIAAAFLSGPGRNDSAPSNGVSLRLCIGEGGGSGRPSHDPRFQSFVLPRGYISPGRIFQLMDDELQRLSRTGKRVDRLVMEDLAYFDLDCPFISGDDTFGHVLAEYLRRRGLVAVLVSTPFAAGEAHFVRSTAASNADVHIVLKRAYDEGERELLRVLKTPTMLHRQGWFEVFSGAGPINLSRTSALLRFGAGGERSTIDIAFFLHDENVLHYGYNRRMIQAVETRLGRTVTIRSQDDFQGARATNLGPHLSKAELQLLQLDEYQLPPYAADGGESPLHLFANKDMRGGGHFLKSLWGRTEAGPKGDFRSATPYYCNIGLLAFRNNDGAADLSRAVSDWTVLAEECEKFEASARNEIFFDFPKNTDENYNVVFLEILVWLRRCHKSSLDLSSPAHWLMTDLSLEAARLFAILCSCAHRRARGERTQPSSAISSPVDSMTTNARVWRHWFSTLSEMTALMQDGAGLRVSTLPGGVSVSGDWFLAVPRGSAAPEVGLEIMTFLTTPEGELERLRQGIGLPARRAFYRTDRDRSTDGERQRPMSFPAAPRLAVGFTRDDLLIAIDHAFKRSTIRDYAALSPVLAKGLRNILDGEGDSKGQRDQGQLKKRICTAFAEARSEMLFVNPERIRHEAP